MKRDTWRPSGSALAAVRKQRDEAIALLRALVEDTDCVDINHHGDCETHMTNTIDGRCANAKARAYLRALDGTPDAT